MFAIKAFIAILQQPRTIVLILSLAIDYVVRNEEYNSINNSLPTVGMGINRTKKERAFCKFFESLKIGEELKGTMN